MSDVLFRTDDELNIQLVRGGSSAVLGYRESDLIGRNLLELTRQDGALRLYKEKAIQGEEDEVVVDVDFLTKTGEAVPMNLSMTVVIETGQIMGFVGVGRDITEKRRSELLQVAIVQIVRDRTGF